MPVMQLNERFKSLKKTNNLSAKTETIYVSRGGGSDLKLFKRVLT